MVEQPVTAPPRDTPVRSRRSALVVPAVLVVLAVLAGAVVGRTTAGFSSITTNPANSFSAAAAAGCAAPSTTTIYADADTYLSQEQPTLNGGTISSLFLQSYYDTALLQSRNYRSLVRFPLPAVPEGCAVTAATLQVYDEIGASGRTIDAVRVNGSWTETGATWANQPATTGAAASAASPSLLGPISWDVLTQTQAMYSDANYGFLLQDSVEDSTAQAFQWLASRESFPKLTVTFGGATCTAPGSVTVTPDADAAVSQENPTTPLGDYGFLYVRSEKNNKNQRSLIRFPLPATPALCTVTAASLALLPLVADTGRTLHAYQAATAWTEATVTWNTQPATTGVAATVASGSAPVFNVLTQVTAMYAGTNTGFVLRDSAESSNTRKDQWLASREAPPRLTLTFGDPPSIPSAPSGLSANASAGRIDLSWTDNATNEDNVRIERSPGGAGTWAEVATVGPNVTTYGDTGLSSSTVYDYRVRASNTAGNSAYSNTASASAPDGCGAPGDQTVYSTGDSFIYSGTPTSNYGTSPTTYGVLSSTSANGRSLVQFDLPATPSGCSVTAAALRVYTSTGTAGRTLHALQNAATWTELDVNWDNAPGSTGSAASTDSVASGWLSWAVTSHVQSMYATSNFGFTIRDSVEGASTSVSQTLTPSEGTPGPELVITFG